MHDVSIIMPIVSVKNVSKLHILIVNAFIVPCYLHTLAEIIYSTGNFKRFVIMKLDKTKQYK